MKKIYLLCLLFLTGCSVFHREDRFVNPLFYKTLEPISKEAVETRLTPTKIYSESVIPEEDCELLKNTETIVSFVCKSRTFVVYFRQRSCFTILFLGGTKK